MQSNLREGEQVVIRPVMTRVKVAYLLIGSPMAVIFPGLVWMASGPLFVVMLPLIKYHMRIRTSRYTIAREHIQIEYTDINQFNRTIPLAYIRDVTLSSSLDQRLLKIGSVVVTTTNGDSINLEDITEPEAARQVIWELVRQAAAVKSPSER
jgi:membrane protein YdbS with pleckstrin-like domain